VTVRGITSLLAGGRGRRGRRWYRVAAAVAAIAGLAALILGATGQLFPGGAGLPHP
jgi:hypothetical protein